MDFLDKTDITQKIMNSVMGGSQPESHDFFSSLNELDPMVRPRKLPFQPPKFNFKIFHLAGPGADPSHAIEYIDIMNKIVAGEHTNSTAETYHTKEGDIRVFLQWYEWPAGNNPNKVQEAGSGSAPAPEKKKKARAPKDPNDEGVVIPDPVVNI